MSSVPLYQPPTSMIWNRNSDPESVTATEAPASVPPIVMVLLASGCPQADPSPTWPPSRISSEAAAAPPN